MIDSIQSFGDSFIYGSDLNDCKKDSIRYPSMLTWPALIAKNMELMYECHAIPGCGNFLIQANVIQHAKRNSLNVINWSWVDRFDYCLSNKLTSKTIRPTGDQLSQQYYKIIHSELDDKFRSLSIIYATHHFLYQNGYPFIATYMDHLLFDRRFNKPQFILTLQDLVKQTLTNFSKNQTFLEWSRTNNYPESDRWHPLEEAHEAAARYWQPIYEKEISKHIKTK